MLRFDMASMVGTSDTDVNDVNTKPISDRDFGTRTTHALEATLGIDHPRRISDKSYRIWTDARSGLRKVSDISYARVFRAVQLGYSSIVNFPPPQASATPSLAHLWSITVSSLIVVYGWYLYTQPTHCLDDTNQSNACKFPKSTDMWQKLSDNVKVFENRPFGIALIAIGSVTALLTIIQYNNSRSK